MRIIPEKKLLYLRPVDINVTLWRARKDFDEYEMRQLTESIRVNGVIEPLTVRKNENGCYELISGERRLKAAICAGLRRVPCILHKTDAYTSVVYSIIENLRRCDLNYFELAEALNFLLEEYEITQSELSLRLGLTQAAISNKLRLLKLDTRLRRKLVAAELSERHARALLRLPPHNRNDVLDVIINNGLNITRTEAYITDFLNPKPQETTVKSEEKSQQKKAVINDVRLFSNSLTKLIDTLKNAGFNAQTKKYENDKYIEYKVRIKKEEPLQNGTATQLRIC